MIHAKLQEHRGEVCLYMALALMVGMLLFSAALQVQHVYSVLDRVVEKTDAAVLAVAARNVPEVYGGVRESSGVARTFRAGTWAHLVSTAEVLDALCLAVGGQVHGSGLRVTGSFEVEALRTTFVNLEGENLNFTTTLDVVVPLSFGGGLLPPLRKTLEVHSTYEPKF